MPPRETPHPYEPTASRYLIQRPRLTDREIEIEEQRDWQRRNRFARQLAIETRAALQRARDYEENRRRERVIAEHDQHIHGLLNSLLGPVEQMPTFEGDTVTIIPPPPQLQRRTAGRVTAAQNQQNIQNQQNQPPPPRFL